MRKKKGSCSISGHDRGRRTFEERSGKMHFAWQGAMAETCSSEMLRGQGVDFLKRVAF